LLTLPTRPAILIKKRGSCDAALPGVAPGLSLAGRDAALHAAAIPALSRSGKRPAGLGWLDRAQDLALVMTSANPGGEPLVVGNNEALLRLYGIADAFLMHDRDIVSRCDDSVARITAVACSSSGGPAATRRGRSSCRFPVRRCWPLAAGSRTPSVSRVATRLSFRNILAISTTPRSAIFSRRSVAQMVKLLGVEPAIVAHDLHPDFHSTRFAADFAEQRRLPLLGVQHHHAHAAAVLAEHGMQGKALALSLDGVGVGTDGAAWGGELLRVDGDQFERLGSSGTAGAAGRRPRRQRTLANGGRSTASTRPHARDRRALSRQQRRRLWRRCWPAMSIVRRHRAWDGSSMPLPVCSASRR
jgi:hydrogenase maturation protein HypF